MTPSPLQGSSSASAPRRTSARAGSGCADRSREEAPPWTTSARYQQSHTFARRGADCEGDVSGEVIDAGPRWETIAGTFRPSDHVTAQPSNLRGAFRTRGVLPSIILEKQHALGLDAIDVNILLQLARHWWYRDNPPHPSKASIAHRRVSGSRSQYSQTPYRGNGGRRPHSTRGPVQEIGRTGEQRVPLRWTHQGSDTIRGGGHQGARTTEE